MCMYTGPLHLSHMTCGFLSEVTKRIHYKYVFLDTQPEPPPDISLRTRPLGSTHNAVGCCMGTVSIDMKVSSAVDNYTFQIM